MAVRAGHVGGLPAPNIESLQLLWQFRAYASMTTTSALWGKIRSLTELLNFSLPTKVSTWCQTPPTLPGSPGACCPPDKNDETRNFCKVKLPKCFHVMDLLWCLLVFWVRRVSFWRCPGHPRLNDQSRCLSSAQLSF